MIKSSDELENNVSFDPVAWRDLPDFEQLRIVSSLEDGSTAGFAAIEVLMKDLGMTTTELLASVRGSGT